MAQLLEENMVGKVESFEEFISIVDSGHCPLTTSIPKGSKQTQALHNWQVEEYEDLDLEGTPDGVDVTDVEHSDGELLQMNWGYFRHAFGVSTLAEQAEVHGAKKAYARQVHKASVAFKRKMEKRIGSDLPARNTDDAVRGREFAGMFDRLSTTAQSVHPIPADYRPSSAYTGAIADFDEDEVKSLIKAAYKESKGVVDLTGFVGIDLKDAIDNMLVYKLTKTGKSVAQTIDTRRNKVIDDTVDQIVVAGGKITLRETPFLRYSLAGAEQAGTHLSGLFINLKMWKLNWNQAPTVHNLENRGGGKKGYIDAVANLICLNPLGQRMAKIDS
jgi:hypothetical protein